MLNDTRCATKVLQVASLKNEEDLTVGEKIKFIFTEMSKRAESEASCKRNARFTKELSTERLRGWDFLELSKPGMVSYQRQLALHKSDVDSELRYSPSWLSIAQEIPVYFGRNLGELIIPKSPTLVCKNWSPLPGGFELNYLAATVHCLLSLSRTHGYEDCCRVLDNLIWDYQEPNIFDDCDVKCMHTLQACVKKPQRLCKPRKINWYGRRKLGDKFYPQIPVDGAIVFTNSELVSYRS